LCGVAAVARKFEVMPIRAGFESLPWIVGVSIVVIILSTIYFVGALNRRKRGNEEETQIKPEAAALHSDDRLQTTKLSYVIIEPPEKKWLLQSRVANAKTTHDFFNIFDDFDILHKLKLPVNSSFSDITDSRGQVFRDLVRDKININDVAVDIESLSENKNFEQDFHGLIKSSISQHLTDSSRLDSLAMYICGHLSRTRAGGDTLFAVKDIFDSPQVSTLSLCPPLLLYSLSTLLPNSWLSLLHTPILTHPPIFT
jgi:hypothetical protein